MQVILSYREIHLLKGKNENNACVRALRFVPCPNGIERTELDQKEDAEELTANRANNRCHCLRVRCHGSTLRCDHRLLVFRLLLGRANTIFQELSFDTSG